MARTATAAVALIAVLAQPAGLAAKGATVRITLRGAATRAPIDITDPHVVKQFQVWAGPGVTVSGIEQIDGFIIDWRSGVMANPPDGLQRYEVTFYVEDRSPSTEVPAYVVTYAHDPASGRGYVYLPGKGDAPYAQNSRAMFHGHDYEGHWFHANWAWVDAVQPLLAR